MSYRFQDPRGERLSELSSRLSDGLHDEELSRHLAYGGMHPLEAVVKVEILRAKSDVINHYRKSLRRWQRSQNISGLFWYEVEYCGHKVEICELADQLSTTKQDRKIMRSASRDVLDFLCKIQKYFKCWKDIESKDDYPWQECEWIEAYLQLEQCDWIQINFTDSISTVHLVEKTHSMPDGGTVLRLSNETYERPNTHFTIYAGKFPSDCVEAGCIWFQLDNSNPSW